MGFTFPDWANEIMGGFLLILFFAYFFWKVIMPQFKDSEGGGMGTIEI
jgi:hypothetical protein